MAAASRRSFCCNKRDRSTTIERAIAIRGPAHNLPIPTPCWQRRCRANNESDSHVHGFDEWKMIEEDDCMYQIHNVYTYTYTHVLKILPSYVIVNEEEFYHGPKFKPQQATSSHERLVSPLDLCHSLSALCTHTSHKTDPEKKQTESI